MIALNNRGINPLDGYRPRLDAALSIDGEPDTFAAILGEMTTAFLPVATAAGYKATSVCRIARRSWRNAWSDSVSAREKARKHLVFIAEVLDGDRLIPQAGEVSE